MYNPTNGSAPEMLWRTRANCFGIVSVSDASETTGVYNPTNGTDPGVSQCTSPIAKSLLMVVFLLYYLYIVMFDGHVCSLLLISLLILVRPCL